VTQAAQGGDFLISKQKRKIYRSENETSEEEIILGDKGAREASGNAKKLFRGAKNKDSKKL